MTHPLPCAATGLRYDGGGREGTPDALALARGFITVALRAPIPGPHSPLSLEGDGTKAPGERTRESGDENLAPRPAKYLVE